MIAVMAPLWLMVPPAVTVVAPLIVLVPRARSSVSLSVKLLALTTLTAWPKSLAKPPREMLFAAPAVMVVVPGTIQMPVWEIPAPLRLRLPVIVSPARLRLPLFARATLFKFPAPDAVSATDVNWLPEFSKARLEPPGKVTLRSPIAAGSPKVSPLTAVPESWVILPPLTRFTA